MLKFTLTSTGWEITEKGQVIFSEIETIEEAVAIARVYGGVLAEFQDLEYQKVAA